MRATIYLGEKLMLRRSAIWPMSFLFKCVYLLGAVSQNILIKGGSSLEKQLNTAENRKFPFAVYTRSLKEPYEKLICIRG